MKHVEQTLKTGSGRLHGVSNDIPQQDRWLWIYDGATVIVVVNLDEAFPNKLVEYVDEEVLGPGMVIDVLFRSELRIVTNGIALTFYWMEK